MAPLIDTHATCPGFPVGALRSFEGEQFLSATDMSDTDTSWSIPSTQPFVITGTSSSAASVKVKGCA